MPHEKFRESDPTKIEESLKYTLLAFLTTSNGFAKSWFDRFHMLPGSARKRLWNELERQLPPDVIEYVSQWYRKTYPHRKVKN